MQKKPIKTQIQHCKNLNIVDLNIHERNEKDWYCLLHKSQGDLSYYQKGLKYMLDSKNFLTDSLFCEWAYIINLDTNQLEIYKGLNKSGSNAVGRYADKVYEENQNLENGFIGVSLILSFDLKELKDLSDVDFLSKIEQASQELVKDI